MKKRILRVVDMLIFILCFLFILSSFFKVISYTFIEEHLSAPHVLTTVWMTGVSVAIIFTRPLYQEILAWRLPMKEWLRFHRLK